MNIQFSGIAIGGIALMLLLGVLGFVPNMLSGGTTPLAVIAPNGGEIWQKGSTQTIQWNISKPGSVTIQLQKAGVTILQIAKSPSGSTSYRWTIPSILTDGANYKILITAGKLSDVSDANFSIVTPDTMAPSTPIGLSVTMISSSQINFVWNPSTDNVGVVGYRVYRNNSQIATTNTSSYADNGLLANTAYVYAVAATDAAGNVSALSSSISATTQPLLSTKFSLNERVQTTANVNVRSMASTTGTLLGTQPTGAAGGIVGGPVWASSYWWWEVNFDTDPDGWVVEDYLAKEVVSPPPAPPPTTPSPAPPPVTPPPTTSPSSYFDSPIVTILSPSASEAWQRGKTYSIRWNVSAANQPTGPVATVIYLDIVDRCGAKLRYSTIATNATSVLGDNSYQWTIPADFKEAQNFYITLQTQTLKEGSITTSGRLFTIYATDPALAPNLSYLQDAKVTVLYPNGGEVWQPGNTYTIKWNFEKPSNEFVGPFSTSIGIRYATGDTRVNAYIITYRQFLTNIGSNQFSWTFPTNAKDINGIPLQGGNFRVVVQIDEPYSYQTLFNGCVPLLDESGQNFSLGSYVAETESPTFTIFSPDGGENLKAGTASPINFKITGYANVTSLMLLGELLFNGNTVGKIFPGNGGNGLINITSADTQTTWTAGLHYGYNGTTPIQVTGSGYKLRLGIYQNNIGVAQDTSAASFTIAP